MRRALVALSELRGCVREVASRRFGGKLNVLERPFRAFAVVLSEHGHEQAIARAHVRSEDVRFAHELLVSERCLAEFLLAQEEIGVMQTRREELKLHLVRLFKTLRGLVEFSLFERDGTAEVEQVAAAAAGRVVLVEFGQRVIEPVCRVIGPACAEQARKGRGLRLSREHEGSHGEGKGQNNAHGRDGLGKAVRAPG